MKPNLAVDLLESKRPDIEAIFKKYGVSKVRLFGSSVRETWDPISSDFDLLAEFGEAPEGINLFKQFFGLKVELEELLGRKVDLVDWKAITKRHFRETADAEAQDWYAA